MSALLTQDEADLRDAATRAIERAAWGDRARLGAS